MNSSWIRTKGIVVRGHRAASQPTEAYPYPTLEKQNIPFKERGLNLDHYYQATLNVSIKPHVVKREKPLLTLSKVEWTDRHPPEDFSFSPCNVWFNGTSYHGMIYYPHPETKIRMEQDSSVLEILVEQKLDIDYDDEVELEFNGDEFSAHVPTENRSLNTDD